MPNLYEKYGGFDFFHNVIYRLYLEMFDHPEIAYHFLGVDMVKLSLHQTQFLVRSIGGPDNYRGGTIFEVHKNMNITPFEFNEIAKAFSEAFIKSGVSVEDTQVIMKFVAGFKSQVVTKKITWIDRVMKYIYSLFKY